MNNLKKGDIFHDGLFGWWIFDTKTPKGRKLFIYPLSDVGKDPNRKGCTAYHNPENWNLENLKPFCNYYENPEVAKFLKGKHEHFKEAFLEFEKNAPNKKR